MLKNGVGRLLNFFILISTLTLIFVTCVSPAFALEGEVSCLRRLQEGPFQRVEAASFFEVTSKIQSLPFLRKRSLEEYGRIVKEGGALYLNTNSDVGYGIKSDGTLISVFNISGVKGLGQSAVRNAITNGATSLYCSDGPLRTYYEALGFQVSLRREMLPENAGYNLDWPDGIRPDMLYMTLKPEKL